jgi:hypothetical protein
VRVTESGTRFSDLHAVVHAWQPIQRVWSITFAHWIGSGGSIISRLLFAAAKKQKGLDSKALLIVPSCGVGGNYNISEVMDIDKSCG